MYGANHTLPFSEDQNVDHPLSLYAATKKANELIAHSYSHLYRLPTTGLRFFTVYGPWGRPDMAPMLFTRAILEGEPIKVFNYGRMQRDFTYIDDIVEGVVRVLARPPARPTASAAPYAIYNIGNHTAIELETFIGELERLLGRRRSANTCRCSRATCRRRSPRSTALRRDRLRAARHRSRKDLQRFVAWYLDYYRVDRAGALDVIKSAPRASDLARLRAHGRSHDSRHRRRRLHRRQLRARLARATTTSRSSISTS